MVAVDPAQLPAAIERRPDLLGFTTAVPADRVDHVPVLSVHAVAVDVVVPFFVAATGRLADPVGIVHTCTVDPREDLVIGVCRWQHLGLIATMPTERFHGFLTEEGIGSVANIGGLPSRATARGCDTEPVVVDPDVTALERRGSHKG